MPSATAPAPTARPLIPTITIPGDPDRTGALRYRFGMSVPIGSIGAYDWGSGWPGWYLNWQVAPRPVKLNSSHFAQMVRLRMGAYYPSDADIVAAALLNPGSLWLIGNEPDVAEQDNVTPLYYATAYHDLYTLIKNADARARIAIGGVAQPTPLRFIYLDRVLSAYRSLYKEEMPVDVWNVHAFILREERGSWGVGIPPGIDVDTGILYEVADHTSMAIFEKQILAMRRWMAERGLRDKPLIVTEYGVLMPADYGFPLDVVARFMTGTFDYFLNATDPDVGYRGDGNRLVQGFCWYSAADKMFPNSNLFDPDTRAITPLGLAYQDYVSHLK